MINQLLIKKGKDLNYVRDVVLLILDATNNFNFHYQYNKKQITSFRKRLYDNYYFVLDHFYNLKRKDYINDVIVSDIFDYSISILSNYENFYKVYLKSFDDYYNISDDNYDDAYDYFLKNDKNILELKKYLYRCIYLIAYYFQKVKEK